MSTALQVDGVSYNVLIPRDGLKRSGQILDGENAGRLQTGRMERDIIGTYYNYTLTIDTKGTSIAEYDSLYEVLTSPVDCHRVVMPYGQGTIAFDAYVSGVEDGLIAAEPSRNIWGGMTVNFVAMAPKRRP